jgi:SAM-dependent MidA family methyltransferase
MGTLMCHLDHRSDADPLSDIGRKDITSHVDFTAMALAAQDAGLHCLGYTSQAHFLINSGLLGLLENASVVERQQAQMLIQDHEMGELFKVMALGADKPWEPVGFVQGDRSHRL